MAPLPHPARQPGFAVVADAADVWNAVMTVSETGKSEGPGAVFGGFLDLAGVRADQTIGVAGPGGLEMAIALRRAGFDRVRCVRPPVGAGDVGGSDALILTGRPEYLGGLAARAAPLVGDGGVIIARLERLEDDAPIRGALLVCGLEADTTVHELAGGFVVIHRIRRNARPDPSPRPGPRPYAAGRVIPFAQRRRAGGGR
jgi:hypothetical protein